MIILDQASIRYVETIDIWSSRLQKLLSYCLSLYIVEYDAQVIFSWKETSVGKVKKYLHVARVTQLFASTSNVRSKKFVFTLMYIFRI